MCNTCHNFDEWETCETLFKVQLFSLSSFNFSCHFLSLSLSFCFSIEASSISFLSKAVSSWWSFFLQGLFPSGWRLLSPLLLYLPLLLHGWKSPLKDLIEAQRSKLYKIFSSKLPSGILQSFIEEGYLVQLSCWLDLNCFFVNVCISVLVVSISLYIGKLRRWWVFNVDANVTDTTCGKMIRRPILSLCVVQAS